MMSRRLRVGIVGLGFGHRVLLPVCQAAPRCEVVGLCGSTVERTQQAASQAGIAGYRDWQALVSDPDIDAVVIATPPDQHRAIAVAAFAAGKHVFCEKPLAESLDAAQSMATAAAKARTANMVDFEFPDMAGWQDARDILTSGALGRFRHVRVSWSGETYANRMALDSWKRRMTSGGGALNDFVPHCFYNIEWLLGPIRRVWAAPRSKVDCDRNGDTLVNLCLELCDGTAASVSVQTAAFLGDGHSVTVHADEGTLRLVNSCNDTSGAFKLFVGTRQTGQFEPVVLRGFESHEDYRIPAISRLFDRFLTWALTGHPAQPNFEDGLRVQTLLDAAWRSRGEGIWYEVAPVDSTAAKG